MFEILASAFNLILYQPLFNILVLLYEYLPGRDFGIAVIVLTLITKFVLYPFGAQAVKGQKAIQDIQPKIKEVQERFKNDRQKQMTAVMEIYKKEKINPFSSFFPLLIQLPILIALYRLFWRGLQPENFNYLYSFVPYPGSINAVFLGVIDLSKSSVLKIGEQTTYYWPVVLLAILTGIAQFFQTKMIMGKRIKENKRKTNSGREADFSRIMEKQMLYFFPVFTIIILLSLPAALALYWLVSTLFTIGQQYIILKKAK